MSYKLFLRPSIYKIERVIYFDNEIFNYLPGVATLVVLKPDDVGIVDFINVLVAFLVCAAIVVAFIVVDVEYPTF